MPACRAEETVRALLMSLVKTPAANPYCVALALWMTSLILRKHIICCTGPNICKRMVGKSYKRKKIKTTYFNMCSTVGGVSTSSLAIRIWSLTFENTVGWMKSPCWPPGEPPHSRVAPSLFPLSISSIILSNCFWSIWGKNKQSSYYSDLSDLLVGVTVFR